MHFNKAYVSTIRNWILLTVYVDVEQRLFYSIEHDKNRWDLKK